MKVNSSMNLDAVFNLHKVKFSKLDILFKDVDVKSAISRVNVFINIESIFHMFHNSYMEEQINVMNNEELKDLHANIISNTINLASHYRLFFTKNKISTNIVLYMNSHSKYTKLNNIMHVKKYRSKYVYDYTENLEFELLNGVMESAVKAIDNIVDYIEGVYFVTSDRIESSVIPMVMIEDGMIDGQLNIMVTRDIYDLQYVNKKFLVVYPMKEDGSRLITANNLYEVFRDKGELNNDYNIPSYLYSFILSVIGDKRRSIVKVKGMGFSSIYKNLSKLFKALDIGSEEYISFEQLVLSIKEDPKNPSDNRERVVNNYMAIDIDRQTAMVSSAQKTSLQTQIVDRYDATALRSINEKYFDICPINILELNNYSKKSKPLF